MNLKVPFLHSSDIESAAADLLRRFVSWYGKELAPPIPIDVIIEGHLEIDFGFEDLDKTLGIPNVLGATWFEARKIRVHSALEFKEGRASFTAAHEVGHWFLHRPLYEADKVSIPLFAPDDVSDLPAIVCRTNQKKEPAEWQADHFAAWVLMPDRLVRQSFRTIFGDRPVAIEGLASSPGAGEPSTRLRNVAAELIGAGGFSNVSNEAMRNRLTGMNLVFDPANHGQRLF